ncbi:MAG: hypothetical protein JXB47_03800 [Anaerolineae bacterium]|nr:hypothetical protein [Anaerolineae bacterium]
MDVILARLWPAELGDALLLVFLFWRIFTLLMVIIVMLMQPEGSTAFTLMLGAAALFIVMDSIWVFSAPQYAESASKAAWISHNRHLGTLITRAITFVAPLFAAMASRNPKSRLPGILGGLSATGYFLMTWLMYQRD